MYSTNEIFAKMPDPIAAQLFTQMGENRKDFINEVIDHLASQRKLRPIFVQRKPRDERFAWMKEALARKQNEGMSAHLLQIWLVSAHSKLLCDFLDGLGIPHDGEGTIAELPKAPAKPKLAEVVNGLLKKHDPAVVAIYLHAFQATDDKGGWKTLEELLKEEPRLKL